MYFKFPLQMVGVSSPILLFGLASIGLALAVGSWSLGSSLRLFGMAFGPPPVAEPGGMVGLLHPMAIPPFVVWAMGRAAMTAGTIGLLRARYAGTLLYSAGFALMLAPRIPSFAFFGLPTLAELAVDVATLVLAWTHVRNRPATLPAPPRIDPT